MKHCLRILLLLLCFCSVAYASPKREMRAAWVATVWALDWPTTPSGAWVTDPLQQQQLLVQMLDSMQRMNMNCVALQGRTMSDAWYESKYEPWSQWITGTRGQTPSYDPMAFAVQEAHKRGMELHVWINPYRYSSSESQFETNKANPDDYANTHPEWIMAYNGASILNPGLPEVKTRICAVVADLLEKYDVDGILFDDYFYLSGSPMSMDAALYRANNPDGLSQEDWRREQVNEMVRRVQDTIMHTKPWVTFGIGPAPQVASNKAHADKYGVPVGPFSDWQYNSIYSDPLAWMSRGTIDYISPQMYWHVGSSTCDFVELSQWWSMIAEKYGRHFYASHSVSDSKAAETVKEVVVLREDDRIGASGSVLYSIRNAIYKTQGYTQYMRQNIWQKPALPPQKWWRRQNTQLFVTNMKYSSGKLSWNEPATNSNVRYAVYSLPRDSVGKHGQFYSSEYLLGITYDNNYDVELKSGYTYGVSVLDRYGNEYAPVTFNTPFSTTSAPEITYPAPDGRPLLPAYFTWNPVDGADSYFVEIARDNDFKDVIAFQETPEPRFYTGKIKILEENEQYYWRVGTRAANAADVWSDARAFIGNRFTMEAPADGETDVELLPLLLCDSVAAPNAKYTFQVATDKSFDSRYILFSADSDYPRYQFVDSVLASYTRYYVRVVVRYDGITVVSDPVSFLTVRIPVSQPVILKPHDGDTIVSTSVDVAWQQQITRGFRVELSTHEGFAPRLTKGLMVDAYTYQTEFTDVTAGNYYLRVRASDEGGYVDSPVIQIVVQTPTAVSDISQCHSDDVRKIIDNGNVIIIKPDGKRYNLLGQQIE